MFRTVRSLNLRSTARLIAVSFASVLWIAVLSGCKSHSGNTLRVGITPGPAEEILHAVEPHLARQGLTLQIVHFSDYIQPNMALASHDLDVNLYQNVAFLTQFNRDHQTSFVSVGRVYLPLMAIYPGRTKTFSSLGTGARIAIPNDPVNHDRALLLLEKASLLTLQHDAGTSTVRVASNPKQVKLVELDAAQLPRSLADVDAAVINANFALDAGLNPHSGSWLSETRDSPYANVLAVNADGQSDARVRALAAALASPEAKAFITAHYGGAVYPAE